MKLYLVRHGEAVAQEIDPERPLTKKGRADVSAVAKFAAGHIRGLSEIRHSPLVRARETAGIFAKALRMTRKTEACAVLKESDPPKDFEVELNASDCDIMLVGHIPFLPKLAGRLVAGKHSADLIAFAQSALVCLERDDEGKWRVGWMVTPELFTGGCSR